MRPNESFSADFDRILKKTQKIKSSNPLYFLVRSCSSNAALPKNCRMIWDLIQLMVNLSTPIELLVKNIRGDYSVSTTHCLLQVFPLLHLFQSLVQDALQNCTVLQAFV